MHALPDREVQSYRAGLRGSFWSPLGGDTVAGIEALLLSRVIAFSSSGDESNRSFSVML